MQHGPVVARSPSDRWRDVRACAPPAHRATPRENRSKDWLRHARGSALSNLATIECCWGVQEFDRRRKESSAIATTRLRSAGLCAGAPIAADKTRSRMRSLSFAVLAVRRLAWTDAK